MFLIGNLVVAFASAIVPLLVAIANADYLRHLYQEALAYSPIVGELYVWTGGFAAFAFLLTWAREMVKDIEDIEGDREMECRTLPIVWGQKSAKIFVTSLLLVVTAIIVYMLLAVLPFPHEWKSLPTRYVVFGLIVPILCSIVLLWAANNRTELHRVQTIIKFTMFMGVLFSYVVAMNLR
jgi:4-hydroxybenzoate polyprenyltransferase